MGIRADIRDELKKESVTKIHGQPTSHDLTILEKELIAILAGIPTALGGGNFGHVGVIMEAAAYLTMTAGTAFVDPANPGVYPAGLAANAAATIRARAEAEHKELINQFETFEGVRQGVKDLILEAVDNEYLIEIEHETLGFLNQTPRQMLNHLLARGGALDFADTKELLAERDGDWNVSENPQLYFNRVEKAMKGLLRNGIASDTNERRDIALFYLKATGEFDAAVREWEAKPAVDKTWANIKTFISTEYAKENKQNKLTAKQFKVNAIDEQAEATEELIAALTEAHTKQMETLIKSTTETMKEMMLLLKENKNTINPNKLTDEEKKKKRDEKRKKYNDAPICKHCGKKHPTKAEDDCWELEKNKDSRPSNWKSAKST
jgi:hypothetical protein